MLYVKLKPSAHIPNGIGVRGEGHPILQAAKRIKERELTLAPKRIELAGYSGSGKKVGGSLSFESGTGLLYRATTVGAFAYGLNVKDDRLLFTASWNIEYVEGKKKSAIITCESATQCMANYYGKEWDKHIEWIGSIANSLGFHEMKAERRYLLIGIDVSGLTLLRGLDGGEVVVVGDVPIENVFVIGKRMARALIRLEDQEFFSSKAENNLSSDLRLEMLSKERRGNLLDRLHDVFDEGGRALEKLRYRGGEADAQARQDRVMEVVELAGGLGREVLAFYPKGPVPMGKAFFDKAGSEIQSWLSEMRQIAEC